MTPDDFNKKASEYVGATCIDAWNLVSPAMLLLHTVAERDGAASNTNYYPPPLKGFGEGTRHWATLFTDDRHESEHDTTLPRAVCRCVAAWLGWGEIIEEGASE